MKTLGNVLSLLGLVGVGYFGYEFYQSYTSFSAFGAEVSFWSEEQLVPLILSGVVLIVGLVLRNK